MKKIFFLSVLIISLFTTTHVNAANKVDYNLTITNNYDFIEEINYEISDYKQVIGGSNYFSDLINDDMYVDITYKTKYKKTMKKANGKYYVKLKYIYNEYTFSNSLFLNNCFEDEDYDYGIDGYSFIGKGGFNCLHGDSLKMTLKTDYEVTSSNALVSGNTYTWNPSDENFQMNIEIKKTYPEQADKESGGHGIDEGETEETNDSESTTSEEDDEIIEEDTDNEKENNFLSIGSIIFVIIMSAVGLITYKILKNKKESLNKI